MKTKIKILSAMAIVLAVSVLLTFPSCEGTEAEEPCASFECKNGGEKNFASFVCSCICPAGFGGDHCETVLVNCTGVECPVGKEPNPAKDCLCE